METNQLLQQLGIRAGESVLADIHYVLTGRYKGQWSITVRGKVVAHLAEAVLTGGVVARVNEVARQRVICGIRGNGNPICSHPSKDGTHDTGIAQSMRSFAGNGAPEKPHHPQRTVSATTRMSAAHFIGTTDGLAARAYCQHHE